MEPLSIIIILDYGTSFTGYYCYSPRFNDLITDSFWTTGSTSIYDHSAIQPLRRTLNVEARRAYNKLSEACLLDSRKFVSQLVCGSLSDTSEELQSLVTDELNQMSYGLGGTGCSIAIVPEVCWKQPMEEIKKVIWEGDV
jgi:hypothetical protein